MKKATLILLLSVISGIGFSQNTYTIDSIGRCGTTVIASGFTITEFASSLTDTIFEVQLQATDTGGTAQKITDLDAVGFSGSTKRYTISAAHMNILDSIHNLYIKPDLDTAWPDNVSLQ